MVPLAQHSIPAQPGLGRLQDEKLEEPPIIVDGDAPFLVVVGNVIGFGEINPGTATLTRLLCHLHSLSTALPRKRGSRLVSAKTRSHHQKFLALHAILSSRLNNWLRTSGLRINSADLFWAVCEGASSRSSAHQGYFNSSFHPRD